MAASTDPTQALEGYYGAQTQKVNDNYAIGLVNNSDAQTASDLSYSQKLAALQDRLSTATDNLPNSYAGRGLLNSGIYNYGGGGASPEYNGVGFQQSYPGVPGSHLGAWQENAYHGNTAMSDLRDQQSVSNSALSHQAAENALAQQSGLGQVNATQALDQSRQAISDAISGVGL